LVYQLTLLGLDHVRGLDPVLYHVLLMEIRVIVGLWRCLRL
jgi:hypothetical protein